MERAKTRQSGGLCALCGFLLVVAGALWAEENEAEGDGNVDAGDDVVEIELVEVEDGDESETNEGESSSDTDTAAVGAIDGENQDAEPSDDLKPDQTTRAEAAPGNDDDDPLDLEILLIEEPTAPDKKPAKPAGSKLPKGSGGNDLELDIEGIDALLDDLDTAAIEIEAAEGTPTKATSEKKPAKDEDLGPALDIDLLDVNLGARETQPTDATPPAGQTPQAAVEQEPASYEDLVPALDIDLLDVNLGAGETQPTDATPPDRQTPQAAVEQEPASYKDLVPALDIDLLDVNLGVGETQPTDATPPAGQTPKIAAEQKPSQEGNFGSSFEFDLPDLNIGAEKTKTAPRMTGTPPSQAKARTATEVDQRSTAKTVAPPNQQNLPRAINAEILPELIPELVPQPEAPPTTRAPPGDSTRREEPRWTAPFPGAAPAPADPELQRLDRLVRQAEQIVYAEILEKPAPDSLKGANGTFNVTIKVLETWKGDHVIGARSVGTGPPSSSGNGLTANGVSHAILFLRQGRVLSAEHGVIPVKPGDVLGEARLRVLKTPAMRQFLIDADSDDGGRPPLLLNIPVTLGIWQQAFNEKDLHWVMRCYSRRHPLWIRYRSGAAGQRTLTLQMAGFHGRVSMQVQNWRHLTEDQVEVSVSLSLKQNDVTESRTATMVFILEGGEWRILREGF